MILQNLLTYEEFLSYLTVLDALLYRNLVMKIVIFFNRLTRELKTKWKWVTYILYGRGLEGFYKLI